jgi:hypothetical protein
MDVDGPRRRRGGTVRISGRHVVDTLYDLQLARTGPIRVRLVRDSSDVEHATLDRLHVAADGRAVEGRLQWQRNGNRTEAGKYEGKATLSEFAESPPVLAVELRSRLSIWLLVLIIAAGVYLSNVAIRKYALKRRRERALAPLLSRVDEYMDRRKPARFRGRHARAPRRPRGGRPTGGSIPRPPTASTCSRPAASRPARSSSRARSTSRSAGATSCSSPPTRRSGRCCWDDRPPAARPRGRADARARPAALTGLSPGDAPRGR